MSSKQFRGAAIAALAIAAWAAAAAGEVVRLKDGSTLTGRLVRVDGDSLTVRLSIGTSVKVHRDLIESILFSDAAPGSPPPAGAPRLAGAPAGAAVEGVGTIEVKFDSRKVSSKITIDKQSEWDAHVRSNQIVVEFFVDAVAVYSVVDSTTDKTIYQGHEKQLKNETEVADFSVEVPAGTRRCSLVIRNQDPKTYRDDFDPAPIHTVLDLGELVVHAGRVLRVDVHIDRGFLRTSSPKLYRSDTKP